MKRSSILPTVAAALAGVLLFAGPARSQSSQSSKSWSFRLGAGGVYLAGGDLTGAIDGLNLYRRANHTSVEGAFAPVRWGPSWSAELSYRMSSRFDLFLSAGGFRAQRESVMSSTWWTLQSEQTLGPSCRALLVAAGAGVRVIEFKGGGGVRLYAGVGAAFGAMGWATSQSLVSQALEERIRGSWQADKTAPAAIGGITVEWALTPALAFVLEGAGRWAVLSNMKGRYDVTITDFSGSSTSSGTTSAWWALYDSGGQSYPWLVFNETKPTAGFYRDVRSFRLGLSGLAASAGLRVRF